MLQSYDERNRDLIVNVDGRLSHRDRAVVSPFDSAVQGGDAVWEGLRLYAGRIFRLDEHLARLRDSAKALAFDSVPPDEEITHDFVMDRLVIHGTVNKVVDELLALREAVGDFGEIVYAGVDWVDERLARRSMELMATEVMPRVNEAIRAPTASAP